MPKATTIPKDVMVDYVVKEFERYESHWSTHFSKAEKAYNSWEGKAPKRGEDWQNAVHIPLMVEGEQTITPRLFTALFPTEAPIEVQVEGETPPKHGVILRTAIQHYFKVANVQGHMLPSVSQATLFGTGYGEAGSWMVKRSWIADRDTGERRNTIVESRPDCRHVSFFEMFPHPAKIYMWDGLPIIRRRFCDAEYLKSLADNPRFEFKSLDKALQTESPVSKASIVYGTDNKPLGVKKREEYEILEYWGPWDESYEKDEKVVTKKAIPYWITVINRKIKIRAIPNPYNHQLPPYFKIKLFENPKPSWFGVGIGQIGQSTQDRINKVVNQRLDNVDLVLNKQGVYDGNDNLINTRSLLISKPGKWHKVQDVNMSIKPFEFNDVTASSYNEEKLAKDDFKEATGATTPLQATSNPKEQHRTAMGIQLLQGAAGMRFKPVLRMMEIEGIQQIAMFFFSNLQQFMTHNEWITITGEEGQKNPVPFLLKPEHLLAKVRFIPTGISETVNKEMQIGQLMRFKEITMNDPTVNRSEINKRIGNLFGFKDIEKLLVQRPNLAPNMPVDQQEKIAQRLTEGASPQQIKQELLGPQPQGGGVTPGG